jgi:hypothetical protein
LYRRRRIDLVTGSFHLADRGEIRGGHRRPEPPGPHIFALALQLARGSTEKFFLLSFECNVPIRERRIEFVAGRPNFW